MGDALHAMDEFLELFLISNFVVTKGKVNFAGQFGDLLMLSIERSFAVGRGMALSVLRNDRIFRIVRIGAL